MRNNVEGNFEWLSPQNSYPLRPKARINWDHFLLLIFLKGKMGWTFWCPFLEPPSQFFFPLQRKHNHKKIIYIHLKNYK
jgi:hypothetical protein